jgi:trans-aconitate 2-methyltransferase
MKFGGERLRPALDLIAQIPLENCEQIVDLGCGPGNVTALLKSRWPQAQVTGIDSSEDMLRKARDEHEDINWKQEDISNWTADVPVDLIFSNACLHWLGGHDTLFPSLINRLNKGGVLAVQMPNNFRAPTHQLIEDVLGAGHPLAPGFPVHDISQYYDWLSQNCRSLNLWETTYQHILEGDNPVADWTKSAALRPILDGLSKDDGKKFEQEYRKRILDAYPKSSNGKTVLPFKRLFMVAVN